LPAVLTSFQSCPVTTNPEMMKEDVRADEPTTHTGHASVKEDDGRPGVNA
jgi:hypothetical protein